MIFKRIIIHNYKKWRRQIGSNIDAQGYEIQLQLQIKSITNDKQYK